ncbi:glyoxalase/bleomycin resistance/extradiol dioxygenase family protein [Acidaminobacter sp. JC074]|uniref:VOC family protein n=1 Tax=Acidaminobacter sp. JC074 TaxID=2530199 RepID=UPI001F0FD568|nr:VOC family protein [Acidaminobacter sp. JC074]
MKINSISFGFSTKKLEETQTFYESALDAKLIYKIEGYIILKVGNLPCLLEFSSPELTGEKKSDATSIGFNIDVDDVKKAYDEVIQKGFEIDMPLKHHEWGEIGFSIKDPNGLTIYICKTLSKD